MLEAVTVTVIVRSFSNYFLISHWVPRAVLVTGDLAVSNTDTVPALMWRMAYVLEGQ